MIQALVNGIWKSFDEKDLQPGTNSFKMNSGLYETFRTKNFKPVLLKQHLDRLFQSAEKINLKIMYSKTEIEKMIKMVINNFHEKNQRARVIVSKDILVVYTTALDLNIQIYDGVDTLTVSYERNTPDIKTTDYKGCLNAYKKANKKSCFEAILLDRNNYILEGSRSNVFWVTSNSLFTREDNVLPGITRKTIIIFCINSSSKPNELLTRLATCTVIKAMIAYPETTLKTVLAFSLSIILVELSSTKPPNPSQYTNIFI